MREVTISSTMRFTFQPWKISCAVIDASVGDLASDFTVVVGDDYAAEVGLSPKPQ